MTVLVALALLAALVVSPAAAADGGGVYEDVPTDNTHAPAIEALQMVGILLNTDCAEGSFCPNEPVQRWVMAVWLSRAIYGYKAMQEAPSTQFDDLDDEILWAAPHIKRIVDLGIIEGCGVDPLRFCPEQALTRAEIATVLTRAFKLPPAGYVGFADLAGVENAGDINALAAARLTAGCSADPFLYCPSLVVTRAEMASFLARAVGLIPKPGYQPAMDSTPLPTDPAVRIGTLDNGFTYYLRHNERPGKSVTLRLVVKAGSINEPEPGRGIAHFLEHILFEGTEAYTAESFNATIRSLGAELGPDINAGVWYDQTVYELTVTADPIENVSTALHVLSQMAHAALIDPDGVIAERGVVLDELRFRTETSGGQIGAEFDRIYTQGTPYEGYYPGGTAPSLESMTAEDLRDFYETWYVPSNMALVAVGDVPENDLFALVEEHFGPIEPGTPPAFSLPEVTPDPAPSYHVVTNEAQGYTFISLDIPIPSFNAGTFGGERLLLLDSLVELMIANRLEDAFYRGELAQVDRPHFETFNHNRGLRYYGTNWQGENLDTASSNYLSVLQTAQRYGFTDADLVRAREAVATALEHRLETATTSTDPQYTGNYVDHYLYGADISAPEDRHDRISALLEEVTPEELTDHYRWQMSQAGPIVIAVGPNAASLPSTADLEAAVAAASPRSEPPPVEPEIDQLMAVPEPVEPVSSGPFALLEGTQWEFANGARVVFVYSDIAEATVHLRTRSLGGWSQLEPGARPLAPRAVEAVVRSGFGDLTQLQINRFLEDSTASLSASIGETTEGFDGGANSDDLETLFQLLHLLITAPRVDDIAFEQALNSATIRTQLAEVNPAWQAWVAYNEARFDPAWHRPVATWEQLATMSAESLLDLYQRRLGDVDDMVVAVVGDTDAEVIERLARHYIGTLPAGKSDTFANRHPAPPDGLVRREIPIGENMSAVLQMYHEAEGTVTPSTRVNAHILRVILDDRLTQLVREELGASYIAGVSIEPALTPRPTIYSDLFFTVDADGYQDAYNRVLAILADMVANGPTSEELQQAKAVARADFDKVNNDGLLNVITSQLHLDDEDIFTSRRSLEELQKVTAATVQALAAQLYDKETRVEVIRVPTPRQ